MVMQMTYRRAVPFSTQKSNIAVKRAWLEAGEALFQPGLYLESNDWGQVLPFVTRPKSE